MTNDEEHFEYQLKHGTHAISKENMLKIADLDRKRFLKIVNYLFLLHVTDDEYISEEELVKRYSGLINQFLEDKGGSSNE